MRAIFQWKIGSRTLELGRRTLIMGVVNVTPDSFSDGGQFIDAAKAVAHAERLLDEGASIIDVGGESTRPGTAVAASAPATASSSSAAPPPVPVSEEEERKRVLPVIRDLKKRRPDAVISIDTYKAGVARAAVGEGAEVVNDISGFRWDPKMAKTLAELKVGAVLMHTRGRPEEWRTLPPIGDPVLLVKRELRQWAESATLAGIKRDHLVLDPGFGFGKRFEENYPLLAHFAELQQMGFPLLAGVSRKSFIGRALARDGQDAPVEKRLHGTLAAEALLILKGAHIIRTHDVGLAAEAARLVDAIVASGG
ncbi:MAG TPA: dihydropteroate synthase [Bryobacteraceae bacterium]|nr:dihydropteroate synthase [Bryobacteraceae bacterium]